MRRALLCLFAIPLTALGHSGELLEPHDLWTAWEFDPGVVIPLAVSAILYARGARVSRGTTPRQMLFFWLGWFVLFVSLCSPLHPLGESLFSAHMTQHELLILVAAPLLVLARPAASFVWALPFEWRRRIGRWTKWHATQTVWRLLTGASAAWLLHAVILWVWHIPALFDATLSSGAVHSTQHICFLGSALIFWWALVHGQGRRNYGWGVLYIFTTAVHTSILGALLTFAPSPWYPAYGQATQRWGLTPLQDQQIGGLIMWVPAGLVYTIAGLALFAAWLRASEPGERDSMVEGREYAH